ncbi:hypothetical protein AB833_12385 [Chromatiales bacterium (ex Bugula neritina AB1)]|nr:hypothetical protein AB833_12385 [Chromatiales bacterium (ex Bugula neritina AB1)]
MPAASYRLTNIICLLALVMLSSIAFAGSENGTTSPVLSADQSEPTGRVFVRYRNADTTPGFISHRVSKFGRHLWRKQRNISLQRRLSPNQELLTLEQPLDADALRTYARQLEANANIEFVAPEYRRYTLVEPNDPLYRSGQEPGSQSYLYEGLFSVRAPGAWDITTGSQNSVIAIVDTGVLPQHPELRDRSIPALGYDFISADAPADYTSANDGDGRDADPTDPGDPCGSSRSSWHGTGVASIAAGNSNDGTGMAGVNWNARLLHARALGRCGGTDADIIDAVRWSAGLDVTGVPRNETPAKVINLSIGGPTECTKAWQAVIDELNILDITLVMAAGNESSNALRSSPANCANVITVGASTPGGSIDSGFSNYGLKVTVAAPGRDIVLAANTGATEPDADGNNYGRETGSSFSAAMVTGAISLMHSVNAELSPLQIREILQDSATPFDTEGDCTTYYCGTGILNLNRAVAMAQDSAASGTRNFEQTVVTDQISNLSLNQTLSDRLGGYRDIRYYRINTSESGMLTLVSDSDSDLFGYLLDSRLGVLALDDDSAEGRNFRVAAKVEPGEYFLAVERARHRLLDIESSYDLSASISTDQPTPFAFADVTEAAVNSSINSETISISGLLEPAIITVSGGFYTLNGAEPTSGQGTIRNGDTLGLTLQSSGASLSETRMFLTVGAFETSFAVTTKSSDSVLPQMATAGGGCHLLPGSNDASVTLLSVALLLLSFSRRQSARQTNRSI